MPVIKFKNMKSTSLFILTVLITLFSACSNGQTKTNLTAIEFQEKMATMPDAPVIDVRTPEEFAGGHIKNAKNINWNDAGFETNISTLDKNKPVFVYCLSGGRSGKAAAKMRSDGFKEVYELSGGMMQWRGNNLPEEGMESATSAGMSMADFQKQLDSKKLVLIDFYAVWCAPCKQMEPYFEAIKKEMSDKVDVIRIDADANKDLAKELGLQGLPVIFLYKNKERVWESYKYTTQEEMVKAIQKNL